MTSTSHLSSSVRAPLVWRAGWMVLGFGALGIGALGVVLPLLPTTPLVLLAAFAFGKSAPGLHLWLTTNRRFGPIIADWQDNGCIAPRYKALALTMMGAALVLSAALEVGKAVLAIQLLCMGLAAWFILSRPSHPSRPPEI